MNPITSFARKIYRGCYPIDLLPKQLQRNKYYIVNLDPHWKSGIHWTAAITTEAPSACYYFDSFGRPPPSSIIDSLHSQSKTIYYCDAQIQSSMSVACGYHQLFVLFLLSRRYKLCEIFKKFYNLDNENYLKNDLVAASIIPSLTNLRERPIIDFSYYYE